MSSIFAAQGGYEPAQNFVDGIQPALWVGAATVAVAGAAALFIPSRRRAAEGLQSEPEPESAPVLETVSH